MKEYISNKSFEEFEEILSVDRMIDNIISNLLSYWLDFHSIVESTIKNHFFE